MTNTVTVPKNTWTYVSSSSGFLRCKESKRFYYCISNDVPSYTKNDLCPTTYRFKIPIIMEQENSKLYVFSIYDISIQYEEYDLIFGGLDYDLIKYKSVSNMVELTEAVSSAVDGTRIRMEPGTYDNSGGNLHIPVGVRLSGYGKDSTILKSTISSDGVDSRKRIEFRGFTLDGSDCTNNNTYGLNELSNGEFLLSNLDVIGNKSSGSGNLITCLSSTAPCNVLINNCNIYESGSNGVVTKCTDSIYSSDSYLDIINSEVYDHGILTEDACIAAYDGFGITIDNSEVVANTENEFPAYAVYQDDYDSLVKVINGSTCIGLTNNNYITNSNIYLD